MAETESIVVLKVGTEQSVRNVAELRQYIKELKDELNDETRSAEENRETIRSLAEAQGALKDVMNTSATSIEAAKEAVDLTGKSYNELVHQLADLTKVWRTVTDEADRAAIAKNINEINSALKEMDASKGTFVRNVGNYAEGVEKGLESFSDKVGGFGNAMRAAFQDLPPFLGKTQQATDNVAKSAQLLARNPLIGVLTLLSPLLMKIVSSLQSSTTLMEAGGKIMESLQPVMDFFAGVIDRIAGFIARCVEGIADFISRSNALQKVVGVVSGLGNAFLQYLLTPIRTVIAAAKGLGKIIGDIFKGDFKSIGKDARAAGQEIGDAFRKGFAVKANFTDGKEFGRSLITGAKKKETQDSAKAAGAAIGKTMGQAAGDAMLEAIRARIAEDADAQEADAEMAELAQGMMAPYVQAVKDANAEALVDDAETALRRAEQEEWLADRKEAVQKGYYNAVRSITGSLADILEASDEEGKRSAGLVKSLRVATTLMDTYSAATSAYRDGMEKGGPLLAAAQTAVAVTAGLANLAKIKKVDVSGTGTATGAEAPTLTPTAAPVVTAPQRTVTQTTASGLERFNEMQQAQQVYILSSQLEADRNSRQVQVTQTSW